MFMSYMESTYRKKNIFFFIFLTIKPNKIHSFFILNVHECQMSLHTNIKQYSGYGRTPNGIGRVETNSLTTTSIHHFTFYSKLISEHEDGRRGAEVTRTVLWNSECHSKHTKIDHRKAKPEQRIKIYIHRLYNLELLHR